MIYDSVPKTLAQLEKMLGTVKFKELVGEFVTKPQGKPTIAPESDSRQPSAAPPLISLASSRRV